MSKLIIPVGIPGCGKSTFAESVLNHPWMDIVSTDLIRNEFVRAGKLSATNDMSRNQDVFDAFHERIASNLVANFDVVADATNLRDFARERLRSIASDTSAETHVVIFTNLSVAVSRNLKRSEDRIVPAKAMVSMLEQYEKAMRDIPAEQYDSVTYIENVQ